MQKNITKWCMVSHTLRKKVQEGKKVTGMEVTGAVFFFLQNVPKR